MATKGILFADTVDYAEFAEMAGLSVLSLRQYATREKSRDAFPKPVTPEGMRSPRWARSDAKEWIRAREAKPSGRGRPFKSTRVARYHFDEAATKHLRARLEEANVTIRDVARLLGLSDGAIYMRNIGRSGWTEDELSKVASKLNITLDELAPNRATLRS